MMLFYLQVGPSLYLILKQYIIRIGGPLEELLPYFKDHLEQVQTSHMAPIYPKGKSVHHTTYGPPNHSRSIWAN